MAGKTKIEWTEATWNPITGCTKISEGCRNCYAATMAHRLHAMGNVRYKNEFQVTVHEDLIEKPLQWKKPRIIFVNSMSDLFHDEIPDETIIRIFDTMNRANWHTFQVLTKRSERLAHIAPRLTWTPNIWMGVSVENEAVSFRIDHLRQTNAAIKFISAEPLLGSLSQIHLDGIDWLIVGGESGHHSRPMEQEWVEELLAIARRDNVAFFFKQWGGFNKKANGSLLNGVYYKEYPKVIAPY